MSKDYSDKMEAWLKKQPMRNANGLSISDTYTKSGCRGHDWREPRVVENVLPYLKSKKKKKTSIRYRENMEKKLNELNIWWCLPLVVVLGLNVWMFVEVRSFRKWLERENDEWNQL